MSLRDEIVKLAKTQPNLRAYLLPLLRKAAVRISKVVRGTFEVNDDRSMTLKVYLMGGAAATAFWRRFAMAYTQRKLIVTFDDTFLTLTIPGAGGATGEDPGDLGQI